MDLQKIVFSFTKCETEQTITSFKLFTVAHIQGVVLFRNFLFLVCCGIFKITTMSEVMPICVMYIPDDYPFYKGGKMADANELMQILNGWGEDKYQNKNLGGYLWFVFFKPNIQTPEIQYINSEGVEPMEFEEIKKLIQENQK